MDTGGDSHVASTPVGALSCFCCSLPPNLQRGCFKDGTNLPRSKVYGFATTSLFLSAMHTIFALYVTRSFLEVYLMEAKYFVVCQLIFSVWNALNDPIVGWLMERKSSFSIFGAFSSLFSTRRTEDRQGGIESRRLEYIRFGGLFLSLALFIPFFTWPQDALSILLSFIEDPKERHQWVLAGHFLMSVFVYDGLFTCLSLAQASVLAELSTNEEGRAQLVGWGSVCYGIGASASFVGEYLFQQSQNLSQGHHTHNHNTHNNNTSLLPFQMFVMVLGMCAMVGFWYSTNKLGEEEEVRTKKEATNKEKEKEKEKGKEKEKEDSSQESLNLKTFLNQVVRQKNLWAYAGMKFAQELNCLFFATFVGSFATHLLGDSASAVILSCIVAASAIAPRILTFSLTASLLQGRCESYDVVKWLFWSRVLGALLLGVVFILSDWSEFFKWALLISTAIYLICGRALTETSCEIVTNISLCDVIDEDMVTNQRKNRISSAIIGCCQLLSRPAQSLSPIFVVWILEPFNFTVNRGVDEQKSECTPELKMAIYGVMILLPALCAVAQLVFWRFFSLNSAYLKQIKEKLKGQ